LFESAIISWRSMPHAQPYSVAESFFLDLAHTLARQGKSHNTLKVRGTNPMVPWRTSWMGAVERTKSNWLECQRELPIRAEKVTVKSAVLGVSPIEVPPAKEKLGRVRGHKAFALASRPAESCRVGWSQRQEKNPQDGQRYGPLSGTTYYHFPNQPRQPA
jgi:hypothetical protein